MFEIFSLVPALIPQLHLHLEGFEDSQKASIDLVIEPSACNMQEGHHVFFIFYDEIQGPILFH